ncbi:hypothetical protein HID58_046319 [Brassica napus]|uniref:Uncharacterized protein n=1 Tax=Brassica napus TaxID=3708 RepID=A0ABQ8AXI0_BRANA|nr:hypothetical protein HID58_046319 [Brassica napus]
MPNPSPIENLIFIMLAASLKPIVEIEKFSKRETSIESVLRQIQVLPLRRT